MLATFMEVLDTSVANVALPHIAGSLAASTDEATWVLTSYLVSNAIVLPMTGWCSSHFGRKRFLMVCVALFTLASALCGASPSLPFLITARIFQGAAGGALQPLAQAILLESFPPAKRGVAMAVYGLGVVVAPIIGPTLGGWITDNYSWRWIFYINLPIGVMALMMCQANIVDPQYLKAAKERSGGKVDYIGFAFLAIWLATLQIVLDKGQQDDWFEATWICWFAGISAVCMVAFIIWELRQEHPLVDLRVFKNRNFAMGTIMMTCVGAVLYATITLQPLFLQSLMGYTALHSGMALSPRGIGAIISMMVVGRLIGKVDSRLMIGVGFIILAWTSDVFAGINLQIGMGDIVWPNIVMGMAMGLIFVPMTTMAMGNLPNEQVGNASGLFNLMRNLGGSVGISVLTTMVARDAQMHQAVLVAHGSLYDPQLQNYVQYMNLHLPAVMGPDYTWSQRYYDLIYQKLLAQASLLSYLDNFRTMAIVSLSCVAGVFLFKRVRKAAGPVAGH